MTLWTNTVTAAGERTIPSYQALPPDLFPTLLEAAPFLVRRRTPSDAEDEFKFGLDALLRGFQSQLDDAKKVKQHSKHR